MPIQTFAKSIPKVDHRIYGCEIKERKKEIERQKEIEKLGHPLYY